MLREEIKKMDVGAGDGGRWWVGMLCGDGAVLVAVFVTIQALFKVTEHQEVCVLQTGKYRDGDTIPW